MGTLLKKCLNSRFSLLSSEQLRTLSSDFSTNALNFPEIDLNQNDRICVVSVVGKSSLGAEACKAALVDGFLGQNIFRGQFCEHKRVPLDMMCDIEGYFDPRHKVVFLHLLSTLDADILAQICTSLKQDLNEKGFLQMSTDFLHKATLSLLLIFHVSHIVIIHSPTVQFDLTYLQLFRLLDANRIRIQPYVTDLLNSISCDLPNDWIHFARLCSPRVLFVFEDYGLLWQTNSKKRIYEKHLEDQIYRFLRKSRIITNICSNSLFAVCNQSDFVFISTKDPTIRDAESFFLDLLIKYCKGDCKDAFTADGDLVNDPNKPPEVDNNRQFYDFLWSHVSVALSKGFDDNVGRHNVIPAFEIPTVKQFFTVLPRLVRLFFHDESEKKDLKTLYTHFRSALDIDRRFSESRCAKGLPIAMSLYQESLPSNYTAAFHERKVALALQLFSVHARGPAMFEYARQLREECDRFWQSGHQMCETLSLTGNNCINPVHILPTKSTDGISSNNSDQDSDTNDECKTQRSITLDEIAGDACDISRNSLPSRPLIDKSTGLPLMQHCSNVKLISACNCGRRQASRDDPFTVKAANYTFYKMMEGKCICGGLERIYFPVFEPSVADVKPALQQSLKIDAITSAEVFSAISANLSSESSNSFTNLSQPSLEANEAHLQSEAGAVATNSGTSQQKSKSLQELDVNKTSDAKHSKTSSTVDDEEDNGMEANDNKDEESQDESSSENELSSEENAETGAGDREKDLHLIIPELKLSRHISQQPSTTEYLPGMIHSLSPNGLLPKYPYWSLICLGPSSLYSHSQGVQDQQGFISGTNFLLPWDVTVKLEHSGHLPQLWEGKRPPGIKNKKNLKDGTQFTVKIFIGVEYECPRGHRFMCSSPGNVLRTSSGMVKENGNRVAMNDMPLYMQCVCSRSAKQSLLAQLMRLHVVTPKAPIHVTLNPKVLPSPPPCPVFFPGNTEPVKLSQSAYWILRLPLVYEGDHGPYYPPKDRLEACCLFKGMFGIADFVSNPKNIHKSY